MDIPYPSQHTMSSNHRPTGEMPFKCFICCIAEKEDGGEGVGDRLESLGETHSIFVVFLHVLFLYGLGVGGGGLTVGIVCFIE